MDLQEITTSPQPALSPWKGDYGWALHGGFRGGTGTLISPALVAADA